MMLLITSEHNDAIWFGERLATDTCVDDACKQTDVNASSSRTQTLRRGLTLGFQIGIVVVARVDVDAMRRCQRPTNMIQRADDTSTWIVTRAKFAAIDSDLISKICIVNNWPLHKLLHKHSKLNFYALAIINLQTTVAKNLTTRREAPPTFQSPTHPLSHLSRHVKSGQTRAGWSQLAGVDSPIAEVAGTRVPGSSRPVRSSTHHSAPACR